MDYTDPEDRRKTIEEYLMGIRGANTELPSGAPAGDIMTQVGYAPPPPAPRPPAAPPPAQPQFYQMEPTAPPAPPAPPQTQYAPVPRAPTPELTEEDHYKKMLQEQQTENLGSLLGNLVTTVGGAGALESGPSRALQNYQVGQQARFASDDRKTKKAQEALKNKIFNDKQAREAALADPTSEVSRTYQAALVAQGIDPAFASTIAPESKQAKIAEAMAMKTFERELDVAGREGRLEEYRAKEQISVEGKLDYATKAHHLKKELAALGSGEGAAMRAVGLFKGISTGQATDTMVQSAVDTAIENKSKRLGRDLTDAETAEVTQKVVSLARVAGRKKLQSEAADALGNILAGNDDGRTAESRSKDREEYFKARQDAAIPQMEEALKRVRKADIANMPKIDLVVASEILKAGAGRISDAVRAQLSPGTRTAIAAIRGLINANLKRDSGATVTPHEMENFMIGTGINVFDPSALLEYVNVLEGRLVDSKRDLDMTYPGVAATLQREKSMRYDVTIDTPNGPKNARALKKDRVDAARAWAEVKGYPIHVTTAEQK